MRGGIVEPWRARLAEGDAEIRGCLNEIWQMARSGGVSLVCYCKPAACHGDVIKRIIDSKLS